MKDWGPGYFDPYDEDTIGFVEFGGGFLADAFIQSAVINVGLIDVSANNPQKIRKHLCELVTLYNRKYGGAVDACLKDDGYSQGITIEDEGATASRWKVGLRDRAALREHAAVLKTAVTVFWNELNFSPELPDMFLRASAVLERSSVSKLRAVDTFPTESSESFDHNMGKHMLDDGTYVEVTSKPKEGMTDLAYEIMQVARLLRIVDRRIPVRGLGR